ncbi:DUF3626 domain-containing protein [Quadrisphaera setariae]|uniref:DUF3626 domain-containing protein n=1 Tax=Quadrisphaera setariae TaxID=2593304 RepID=A0A5C8Z5V3_9ACTN|nr:DUF3626 domain-containing protein [Quadrisphaera setariae]TXR52568.1 DUF3626 domain-containing protein [Quadrisphaera setariae]
MLPARFLTLPWSDGALQGDQCQVGARRQSLKASSGVDVLTLRFDPAVRQAVAVEAWQRAVEHVTARVASTGGGPPLPSGAAVVVHLHPDRLAAATGRPVLAQLAADGRYRSQFQTGTSAGGLTAHPGGDRWRWESELFGGAYDAAPAGERPVYGALSLPGDDTRGPALRFGSCHLRLRPEVLDRVTLAFPDSALGPEALGTAASAPALVAATAARAGGGFDALDDYVEAHVHGQLLLARDVEAVVLDPCFRGTAVEVAAERIRATTGVALAWHPGCAVHVAELVGRPGCIAYRGGEVVQVALEVAAALTDDGVLSAEVVGRAVALERWDAQHLKQVWHCIARFGSPSPVGLP